MQNVGEKKISGLKKYTATKGINIPFESSEMGKTKTFAAAESCRLQLEAAVLLQDLSSSLASNY